MIKCPKCRRIIMDMTQNGGYKIRSRMIIFSDGKAIALCPSCKQPVEVPVSLGHVTPETTREKIIVNK